MKFWMIGEGGDDDKLWNVVNMGAGIRRKEDLHAAAYIVVVIFIAANNYSKTMAVRSGAPNSR